MGAVRTWKTGKDVHWQIWRPEGRSMRLIQRASRRLLVCDMDKATKEIWSWSPHPAEDTDWAIWSDFRFWMDQTVYLSPQLSIQMEFWTENEMEVGFELFKMSEARRASAPSLRSEPLRRMPARLAPGATEDSAGSVPYLAPPECYRARR
jgi:hypothetical protein